jgi:hypothetical protein
MWVPLNPVPHLLDTLYPRKGGFTNISYQLSVRNGDAGSISLLYRLIIDGGSQP